MITIDKLFILILLQLQVEVFLLYSAEVLKAIVYFSIESCSDHEEVLCI